MTSPCTYEIHIGMKMPRHLIYTFIYKNAWRILLGPGSKQLKKPFLIVEGYEHIPKQGKATALFSNNFVKKKLFF